MKTLSIDFEFKGQENPTTNIKCVNIQTSCGFNKTWWFFGNPKKDELYEEVADVLETYKDHLFLSHVCLAESRCLLDMGIDPSQFNWFDTSIEFKMLMNFSDLLYQNHLFSSRRTGLSRVLKVVPPHEYDAIADKRFYTVEHPSPSLLATKFAMLKTTDSAEKAKHKQLMTDLILSKVKAYSPSQMKDIMEYCEEDVTDLAQIYANIRLHIESRLYEEDAKKYLSQAIERGNYQASLATIYKRGYAVDMDLLNRITDNEKSIIFRAKKDINDKFPDILAYALERGSFVRKYDRIASYINRKFPDWPTTPTGNYKLDEETLTEFSMSKEKYGDLNPNDFIGHLKKLTNLELTLRGFKKHSDKSIYKSIGTDGRCRPFVPSFGGATGRTQYKSSNMLFLKSKWCRQLVSDPNMVHLSCDYSSQEFLVSALLSGDKNMLEAYNSGDVYVYYGSRYGIDRPKAKAVVLGISYGLTKFGLSRQLNCTKEEAQTYIDQFFELFHVFKKYMDDIEAGEYQNGYCMIKDGWTQFSKNYNFRSFFNFRIQGASAGVLRVAMKKCMDAGLEVIFSLHDAIYAQSSLDNWEENSELLAKCMREAFIEYFDCEGADSIRVDSEAWHEDLENINEDGLWTRPAYLTEKDDKGKPCKIYKEYMNILGHLPQGDVPEI